MSIEEEVDRYQKILEDWRPGGGPKARPAGQRLASAGQARPQGPAKVAPIRAESKAPGEVASTGAILLIGERTLAVYQRAVPEKEYHLVCVMCPNGATKTQGLALQAHQFEEIGALPPPYLEQLQRSQTWDRDLLVFHCYRYEDAHRIPHPLNGNATNPVETTPAASPSAPAPGPAPTATASPAAAPTGEQATPDTLRRGQRFQIKFGTNAWEAVYWGRDTQSHVVAHKTYQKWALMHLDLGRFANSLVADPVDEHLIAEIETSLLEG